MDKYNIHFPKRIRERDLTRLINQLWKLIPMRENNEDWLSHLKVMIEEISGLAELYKDNEKSLILLSKMEGLQSKICNEDFMIYRKTVFRCMDLLAEVLRDEQP